MVVDIFPKPGVPNMNGIVHRVDVLYSAMKTLALKAETGLVPVYFGHDPVTYTTGNAVCGLKSVRYDDGDGCYKAELLVDRFTERNMKCGTEKEFEHIKDKMDLVLACRGIGSVMRLNGSVVVTDYSVEFVALVPRSTVEPTMEHYAVMRINRANAEREQRRSS